MKFVEFIERLHAPRARTRNAITAAKTSNTVSVELGTGEKTDIYIVRCAYVCAVHIIINFNWFAGHILWALLALRGCQLY